MFCTECGAEVKASAKFCGQCGNSIANAEETEGNISEQESLSESPPTSLERRSTESSIEEGQEREEKPTYVTSAKNVQSPPPSSPSKKEIFCGAVKAALIRGDITTPEIIDKRNSGENNNNILLCNIEGKVISRVPISRVLEIIKEYNNISNQWDEAIIKSWEKDSNQRKYDPGLERSRRNNYAKSLERNSNQSGYDPGLERSSRNNKSSSKDSGLIRAFKRRQRDTSWGYAFACVIIPFVGIHYSISRRTITPFLNVVLGSLILGFSIGIVAAVADPDMDEDALGGLGTFAGLISGPFLCKKGIDDARKYAKNRLEKMN